MLISTRDPLQDALNAKKSYSFYSVPTSRSNFFKTQKYDFEHFGLSFGQRIVAFCICLALGALLFFYSFTRLLTVVVNPAAFARPYTFGNLIFFVMFGFLSGFKSYFINLFSKSKRIYTIAFIASTFMTLYFTLFFKSYFLNLILMFVQIGAFACFAVTFLPGGTTGISSLFGLMLKR